MMIRSILRTSGAIGLTVALACGGDSGVDPNRALNLGEAGKHTGPQTLSVQGGSGGADYVAVLVNTDFPDPNVPGGTPESFTLTSTGVIAASTSLTPTEGGLASRASARIADGSSAPIRDAQFEARMRARDRLLLTPRIASAQAWYRARNAPRSSTSGSQSIDLRRRDNALPANVAVGDIITLNVNANDPCTNPVYHGVRVTAIGTHAVVLADTLNPAGGFTAADFQHFAARFDTLVFPLDSAAFGPPTDIDANGHIGLIFTRAVNELTGSNSDTYVGGFTAARDLFPQTATPRLDACQGSNVGEYFYLLAPDPAGTINGNRRTTGFVDSVTVGTIAHELQHLINASRRIYVNVADVLEDTWLDEGLAHVAEELLFYHEAGLTPKANLDAPQLRATQARASAFNFYMAGNYDRYRTFLLAPSSSSPYADNDDLSTRGATWSLLRYLSDQSGKSDFFFRLVNAKTAGVENLSAAYGSELAGPLRDWSTSNAVDDMGTTASELLQPSWNWHSIFTTLSGFYPLQVRALADGTPRSGTLVAGGSAYFKFGVPAGATANITLTDPSTTAAANLQIVFVRTR